MGLHAGGQHDPLAATQNLQSVQISSVLQSSDPRGALPKSIFSQATLAHAQQYPHQFMDAQTRNNPHNANYNALQTEGGKALSTLLSSRASDGQVGSESQMNMPSQRQKRKYRPVLVKN